jgi:biopolymer transport protein TolR
MVTAPLVTQGVKVDLPTAQAQPLEEELKPPLIATVDAAGQYFLNVGDSQDQALSAVDLATLVATHLQLEPQTPVVVRGDGAVAYSEVVQLMVLLQRAGVPSVGLMTTPAQN